MFSCFIQIPHTLQFYFLGNKNIKVIVFYNTLTKKSQKFVIDRSFSYNLGSNGFYLFTSLHTKKKLLNTYQTILNQLVTDLVFTYTDFLYIKGAGFRAHYSKNERFLLFLLGYSHLVSFRLPYGIIVKEVNARQNYICFQSDNRALLYSVIAKLKRLKPVDCYKGKGLFLPTDVLLLKKPKSAEKK